MIDQHFTPAWLADLVADALPSTVHGLAIDPAAGSGALLASLERRGQSQLHPVAMDIDPVVVAGLRDAHPGWTISAADSLNPRSRAASRAWQASRSMGVEVVLLNPPFSYRGGPSTSISFGQFTGRLSPAARFVAMAIEDLRPRYGIVGILPNGVVNGQKYQGFWNEIRRTHDVRVLRELTNSIFTGVRARCCLIEISLRAPQDTEQSVGSMTTLGALRTNLVRDTKSREAVFSKCRCIEIVRGRVPRHQLYPKSEQFVPYLHTTHIRLNTLTPSEREAPQRLATIGPSVVIPRVGYPQGKVALVGRRPVVLSDCLIALRPLGVTTEELADELRADIAQIALEYNGTGAPYITLQRLTRYLKHSGWRPIVVAASDGVGSCLCGRTPKSDLTGLMPVA